MLKIIIDTEYEKYKPIDMEKEFCKIIGLNNTSSVVNIIKEIEQGEYYSPDFILDRFGAKLRISDLSTGCKSALVLANKPDGIADETEIGVNARDAIIRNCRQGTLILRKIRVTIDGLSDDDINIDVEINGYHIKSLKRLNKYLFDEYPEEPDMDGIELYNKI